MREAFNGKEKITTQGGNVAAVYVDEEDTEHDNDSDSELDAIDHSVQQEDEVNTPEYQAAMVNDAQTLRHKSTNKKGKKSSKTVAPKQSGEKDSEKEESKKTTE